MSHFFKECPALTNGVCLFIYPAVVLCLLPVIVIGIITMYKMGLVKQSKFKGFFKVISSLFVN